MAAVRLHPLRRVSLKIQAWRFCRCRPIPPLSIRVAVNSAVKRSRLRSARAAPARGGEDAGSPARHA